MEKKEKDALGQGAQEGREAHLDEHLEQMPAQELPADIPAEVREKLARDLNDKEAAEDLPGRPGRRKRGGQRGSPRPQ